jgi:glycogen phosphorylase
MAVIDPVCGTPVDPGKVKFKAEVRGRTYYFCSERHMRSFLEGPRIAYFSMEIGLQSDIPTYSGGLGVLAGDTVRSSADLRLPLVAVTLVSRKGYLRQKITDDGSQLEFSDEWDPSKHSINIPQEISVRIGSQSVLVRPWIYDYQSPTGGLVPVILLDTDVPGNTIEDRGITDFLYGGDDRYRLKQEMVLGIGGVRMLHALKFNINRYHMNEGHSSLLTLELLKENAMDADKVRDLCIFTTHTPVEAAFDKFSYQETEDLLGKEFPVDKARVYAGTDKMNMTLLALNLSKYVNGVTNSHMEQSKKLFPGYYLRAITNGVHPFTWTCPCFRQIYDRYIPGWANEPELLVRADEIPHEEIWETHQRAKKILLDLVMDRTRVEMDMNILTIGFARRATDYKRATLIFSELDRLKDLNRRGNIQLIFAGKAHPKDLQGKDMIKDIFSYVKQLQGEINIVYLENYDMELAMRLTSGVDLWLNTPLPPEEASGTSGMKAAFNCILNFSVLDGWWIEGCLEGITG